MFTNSGGLLRRFGQPYGTSVQKGKKKDEGGESPESQIGEGATRERGDGYEHSSNRGTPEGKENDYAFSWQALWEGYLQGVVEHRCRCGSELAQEVLRDSGYGKRGASKPSERTVAELGDSLFSLLCMANEMHVNVEDVLRETLVRYGKRLPPEQRPNS